MPTTPSIRRFRPSSLGIAYASVLATLPMLGLGCAAAEPMPGPNGFGVVCDDACDSDGEDTDATTEGDTGDGSEDNASTSDPSDGGESSGGDQDDDDGSSTPEDPPPVGHSMCGDFTCQPEEDDDSCPFDCVPYTIAENGQGQGKICERSHTGFLPLTEIGAGQYLGVAQGGLYPGGSNDRPQAHTEAGLAAAAEVTPVDGQICLISIGMSNTYQKWSMFMTQGVGSVNDLNPALRVANGAVGSHPVDTTADPSGDVWNSIDQQIAGDGCSPEQVRVAWVLHAERGPTGDFLETAEVFKADLRATVLNLADHFPNLEMVYLSSRSYSGYTDRNNNPEPYAYQGGFVVKWLIEDQIEGLDPELSLDSGAPWLSWGPYLWADGLGPDGQAGGQPGRSIPDDGMEYACDDFADDGVHPGMGMRQKISDQLVKFFTSDPTATPWFLQ